MWKAAIVVHGRGLRGLVAADDVAPALAEDATSTQVQA
jgi:hypothetical protein